MYADCVKTLLGNHNRINVRKKTGPTDKRTDRQTPDRCISLSALDVASVNSGIGLSRERMPACSNFLPVKNYRQSLAYIALRLANCYKEKRIFRLKMHKKRLTTGALPGLAGRAYSAPPGSLRAASRQKRTGKEGQGRDKRGERRGGITPHARQHGRSVVLCFGGIT